jgi:hypothetical protein
MWWQNGLASPVYSKQWDEAALGNFGEALCYDVDHVLTDNDCTDSRPMLLLDLDGKAGQWCGNFGGAQFLRYFDPDGRQRRHSRMRTRYLRYCPNLAEVIFAGQTDDHAMEFSFSAGLFRSDDYTRAVHRLRVRVNADTAFSRLVFFQQAADTYAYNTGRTLACGDASHPTPLRQWTGTIGQNRHVGEPVALTGPMPWAMALDSPTEARYAPANRGFVIRSWRARLNGVEGVPPYLAERSAPQAAVLDLVPPPGTTRLKAGDYVDAEIVRFYVPKFASNYCGPNASFRRALADYENTAQIGLREAVGNHLRIEVQQGTLERGFPLQIQATNNQAAFTITGGIGCVPVTFTGLEDYRAPALEEQVGTRWIPVNQAVHGNDYWQCDGNTESEAWEITFTLRLDSEDYQSLDDLMNHPRRRTFRFRLGTTPPLSSSGTGFPASGEHVLTGTSDPAPRQARQTAVQHERTP